MPSKFSHSRRPAENGVASRVLYALSLSLWCLCCDAHAFASLYLLWSTSSSSSSLSVTHSANSVVRSRSPNMLRVARLSYTYSLLLSGRVLCARACAPSSAAVVRRNSSSLRATTCTKGRALFRIPAADHIFAAFRLINVYFKQHIYDKKKRRIY